MDPIVRCTDNPTLTIKSNTQTSESRSLEQFAFGSILVPATTGSITIQVSNDEGATWDNLVDKNGTAVGVYASSDGHRVLPNELFHFSYFRLQSGSAEAADRSFAIHLKS